MKGNEWVADTWLDLGKTLKAHCEKEHKYKIWLCHGYSFLSGVFQWYEIGWERGNLTPDMWDGGLDGWADDIDMKKVFYWHRDHNLFLTYTIQQEIIDRGPVSLIEEAMKEMSEFTKAHRKFSPGINAVYFCPQHHVDAAAAACKKYNKL